MLNFDQDIQETIQKGAFHPFTVNKKYYLFQRITNSIFEIDKNAFDAFSMVSVGLELNQEIYASFYKDWRTVRKVDPNRKKVATILKVYINQKNEYSDLLRNLLYRPEPYLSTRWEVSIQLDKDNADNNNTFILDCLRYIKQCADNTNVKVFVVIKCDISYVNQENIKFLLDNRLSVEVSLDNNSYTIINLNKIQSFRIGYINLTANDFERDRLNESFRNYITLNSSVTDSNYPVLIGQLNELFLVDDEAKIPESFSNIFNVFNFLNSDYVYESLILDDSNEKSSDKSRKKICDTCWARNACWSANLYRSFGAHPYEVNSNNLNCNVIRKMIENTVALLNENNESLTRKNNSKLSLFFDQEEIVLINP